MSDPLKGAAGAAGAFGKAVAPTVGGAAKGSGVDAAAGVVIAELTRTVMNRLTQRSVLKTARLHGAFELLR